MVQLALHTEKKYQHVYAKKECTTVIFGFCLSHVLFLISWSSFKLSSLKSQFEYGMLLMCFLKTHYKSELMKGVKLASHFADFGLQYCQGRFGMLEYQFWKLTET